MSLLANWYDLRDLGNPVARLIEALEDAGLSGEWIFVITGLLGAIGILSFVGVVAQKQSYTLGGGGGLCRFNFK